MKRFTFAVPLALTLAGVAAPCAAQTQFEWAFDEPFVALQGSGNHVVTATIHNTGTTSLYLKIGVSFSVTPTPEFLAVVSNPTAGPTSSAFDFTDQFFASSNYPIAPGTTMQFAAFNFDYDAPGGLYSDIITDGYLALSGVTVAPSNNLTFRFENAVPEPATWAMMILGFGAIGAAMRGRTRGRIAFA